MSNTAKHIEIQNRMYAAFGESRTDDVLRDVSPDVVVEMIPFGEVHRGPAGFRQFLEVFKGAFPDCRIEVKRQIGDGTRLCAEFVATGTHEGPLVTPNGPIPPTGRKVTFTVCEVWDFQGDKVIGVRNYQDAASILRQIGVM